MALPLRPASVLRNAAQTRTELIDSALRRRGWTQDLIRWGVSDGAIEVVGGRLRRPPFVEVTTTTPQPVASAYERANDGQAEPVWASPTGSTRGGARAGRRP